MNKFELDKTMESFGFSTDSCYEMYGCKYHHDNRYFTIVDGKTPYELAKLIREKYDNDKYKIRVNGNHEDYVPVRDIYTYHIDTIEGLVAYIIETKNYYAKTKVNPYELETILDMVYKKILENVNPQINVYDWMLDRNNRKDYFKTLLSNNTYLDFKLRKKIEDFDNCINPFCNNTLNINDNKFKVNGFAGKEYCWFTLTDKEKGISLSTTREENGFVLNLRILTDSQAEINVYHYFDEKGEEIAIEKFDEEELSRIEYNLTNKTFGEHYGEKHQVTTKDKDFVIKTLEEYINLIREIISKNINKKSNNKSLILKK